MGSSREATHEHVNASALADAQLAADRARTRRFPHLLARKVARMSGSPLGFLRGSAVLFYEILGADRELGQGPSGEGWIVGDMRLERSRAAAHARSATAPPKRAWSSADLAHVRTGAIRLAGLHEAIYLAFCDRTRGMAAPRP